MKIINFLKANIAHLVAFCIFATGAILLVVSLFTPMFSISYYTGGYVTEAGEIPLEFIKTDTLGINYLFSSFGGWMEKGIEFPYHMFVQITFMIIVCAGLGFISFLISFIISLFKENLSKKGEFAGATFGIISAIISFATVILLVILLTTTEVGANGGFIYHRTDRVIEPAYILLLISCFLFIVAGAINTAAISEKAERI